MRSDRFRGWAALLVLLGLILLLAAAGAETAADITSACKFNAGSGRKSFSGCKDRDYKTYWRTNNGDKCYVEVTVPAGQTASGVMVQWYEHPHAWGVQILTAEGKWVDAGHTDGTYLAEYLSLPEGTERFRVANAPGEKRQPPDEVWRPLSDRCCVRARIGGRPLAGEEEMHPAYVEAFDRNGDARGRRGLVDHRHLAGA